MHGIIPVGCRQCMPCRISHARTWTHRLMLERLCHEKSCFVTLTYSPENLPGGGSLVKKDYRLFLRRLRKAFRPRKIRFFVVGEYGEVYSRPHFHLALFGVGPEDERQVFAAWGRGHIDVGDLTKDSAKYIAGYVTKKLNGRDERSRAWLNGRTPEFARMSLRPGIGAGALREVVKVLETQYGNELIKENGDVPTSLKHGNYSMPLGRYLRRLLRRSLGLATVSKVTGDIRDGATEGSMSVYKEKVMQMLQEFEEGSKKFTTKKTLRERIVRANAQKVLNLEKKYSIYKKVGKL